MITELKKNVEELIYEKCEELKEVFETIADPFEKTVNINQINDIIGDICIILILDLKEADRFFYTGCHDIPIEINQTSINFDDFQFLLKIHIKEYYEIDDILSNNVFERIENNIKNVYEDFCKENFMPNVRLIPLARYDDLRKFTQQKIRNKSFLKKSKALKYKFDEIISKTIENNKTQDKNGYEEDNFIKYLFYIKNHQKGVTKNDFLYILRKLDIVTLPKKMNLFKKVEKTQNLINLDKLKQFLSKNYLNAIELFEGYSQLNLTANFHNKADMIKLMNIDYNSLTIKFSQVCEFLKDFFGSEFRIYDCDEEIQNNLERLGNFLNAFIYDFVGVDKEFYQEITKKEPHFFLDLIFNFLEFLAIYIDSQVFIYDNGFGDEQKSLVEIKPELDQNEVKPSVEDDHSMIAVINSITEADKTFMSHNKTEYELNYMRKTSKKLLSKYLIEKDIISSKEKRITTNIIQNFEKNINKLKNTTKNLPHDLNSLQNNLKLLFKYYHVHDPILVQNPKQQKSKERDGKISQDAVLQFCYNFDLTDKLITKKKLALIMEHFSEFLDYNEFLRLLRCLSYEIFSNDSSINHTQKLQKFLTALGFGSALSVTESMHFIDKWMYIDEELKVTEDKVLNDKGQFIVSKLEHEKVKRTIHQPKINYQKKVKESLTRDAYLEKVRSQPSYRQHPQESLTSQPLLPKNKSTVLLESLYNKTDIKNKTKKAEKNFNETRTKEYKWENRVVNSDKLKILYKNLSTKSSFQ